MPLHLRRRPAVTGVVLGLLAVGVVVLVVLALPLLKARSEAKAAVASVQEANTALKAHHLKQARTAIDDAHGHVDQAQGSAHGFGADVWSQVPFFGGAVDDARHLIDALDQATSVGDLGVRAYRQATGPSAGLIKGDRVDLTQLRRLSALAGRIGPHLDRAQSDLAAVNATTPFVGGKIGALRDSASGQLSTAQTSFDRFGPLLRQLPAIMGGHGSRSYLVTILNPAEQRYSGGATLSMSTLRISDGRITFGQSYSVSEIDSLQPFLRWPKVPGNVFRHARPTRLTAATYSPWWQVSGEELLRAWRAQTGQQTDGLIAIDLQGLAQLFRLTGPVQVAGYGELNGDNLVHTLAGSYDTYQDPTQRHELNQSIIPAFRAKLLSGGKFAEKGRTLLSAAQGRHFATYFRDAATQDAARTSGLAGNLSDTPRDYLGVFSQNVNGSKSDYWQQRQVASTVRLRPDGSAVDRVDVSMSNHSPAYTQDVFDAHTGYLTRWLEAFVSVFLPQHATLRSTTVDGAAAPHTHLRTPSVADVTNRPFLLHRWVLSPGSTHRLRATYRVPAAAEVTADGDLDYQLTLDPQDLVSPQQNQVTLHIPDGYRFGTLPAGWRQKNDRTAVLTQAPLTSTVTYSVPVLKG